MTYSYNISIVMLLTIAVYFIYLRRLINHMKEQHEELYESHGGKRFWYSAPDQLRFFGWLFMQRHRNLEDPALSRLAITTQVLLILGVFCMVTMPLSIRGSG